MGAADLRANQAVRRVFIEQTMIVHCSRRVRVLPPAPAFRRTGVVGAALGQRGADVMLAPRVRRAPHFGCLRDVVLPRPQKAQQRRRVRERGVAVFLNVGGQQRLQLFHLGRVLGRDAIPLQRQ